MLEYRALGGLAVADRGDDVSIGGPRQRRLVAMLLVHRNSVVSADRLSEAVFGRGLRSRPGGVGPVAGRGRAPGPGRARQHPGHRGFGRGLRRDEPT
jgi:hypothetical protein